MPPLKEEQIEIVKMKVDDVPVDKLFTPVPLVARLSGGVQDVKAFALRQREEVSKQASGNEKSSAATPATMPHEARIKEFSNSGSVKMGFSKTLKVPEGTTDRVKEQTESNRRRMAAGDPPEESLISVFAVKEDEGDNPEIVGEPILDVWELISLDSEGFEIQLNFSNPIGISNEDTPDLLLIQLDLSSFEDE